MVGIIPVEIDVAGRPVHGGLADLARTADQGHLAVAPQVVADDGGVDTNFWRRLCVMEARSP